MTRLSWNATDSDAMKAVRLLFMGLGLVVLAASGQDTNNAALPSTITIDGVTYDEVRWGAVTPSAVSLFHKTGVASIPLEKLPPELQQQLGYDAKKAAKYRAAEAEAQTRRKEAQAWDAARLRLVATGVSRSGVPAFNAGDSPFAAYDKAIIGTVQSRWYALAEQNPPYERSGKVALRFDLMPDGKVEGIETLENSAGDMLKRVCEKAIAESAPFDSLPDDLRKLVGNEPREVRITFYYGGDGAQPMQAQGAEALRGTIAYLDARNGFRDLKFGQSIAQCPGMRLVKSDYRGSAGKNIKTYVRDSDDLRIGTARLESIVYVFFKDRLMAVDLSVKDDEDMAVVTGAFSELYGEGKVGSWEGERVSAHGFIGGLEIISKEIEALKLADEQAEQKARAREAAREGATGF